MNARVADGRFNVDPWLLTAATGLLVFGTIMVSSASIAFADGSMGRPHFFLSRHLVALAIGGAAALTVARIPCDTWYRCSGLIFLVAFALLVSVFIPGLGHTVNGSTRWLNLGPLSLQPSDPARLCLMVYLCSYVVRHHERVRTTMWGFIWPLVIVTLACALLLAEPDFGAAAVLIATSLGILFIGGARLLPFILCLASAVVSMAYLATSSDYRLQRLIGFLDPWADPFDSGFQLTQSLIAIGRGDWLGVGLGESVQKMFYLPEAHTDFVFAVLAEELGFLGSTAAIVLYGVLVIRAIAMTPRAYAVGLLFQALLSSAIGLMLGIQAFINIGVNTGLLPTKGLTLPLMSYGRTSVVITLVSIGLLARIHHEVIAASPEVVRARRKKRPRFRERRS
ncbi:MAG: putative lipid II flippase FtsW [Rhodospirillaceae bacterium]|nr:putative lipid II flippase FtsW [Rhodospirillaceae bacterium]